MSNESLEAWSTMISAVSTVGVLWLTSLNYRIYRKAMESQAEFEQKFSDLMQAIVVSTMTQGSGGAVSVSIDNFNRYYKGKTQVFKQI